MESLLFPSPRPCHLEKSVLAKSLARYMESYSSQVLSHDTWKICSSQVLGQVHGKFALSKS